jgi:nucleotide-binding universal stress UspA family protein
MTYASVSTDRVDVRPNEFSARYRDIMVHLDGTAEDEVRLAHAETIVAPLGAHLTGLYTNMLVDPALYSGEAGVVALAELDQQARDEGKATLAKLTQRFARLSVESELRKIEARPGPRFWNAVATEARLADLFIATRPHGHATAQRWGHVIESVIFQGGHGLYLVPPGVKPREAIRTILVGWLDTREAARAVAEALPLMTAATSTELVCVRDSSDGRFGGAEALADIAAHLARHGVWTTVSILPMGNTTANALLGEAKRISADIIVTGAYGHSRLREWILGGVTDDLLRNSDLPVFMAH